MFSIQNPRGRKIAGDMNGDIASSIVAIAAERPEVARRVKLLGATLAVLLLTEFDIAWVKLSVNKPGAIRGSRDVGVEIVRHKSQVAAG